MARNQNLDHPNFMKRFCILILLYLLAFDASTEAKVKPQESDIHRDAETNEVNILSHTVRVPIGRILLVRKDADYCAVKFLDVWWTGESRWETFNAIYESYYQGDKSGDISKTNVKHRKEKLYMGKPKQSFLLGAPYIVGKTEISCGSIKLSWTGPGYVYFHKSGQKYGDHGIELAPTQWTEISEVNVFDPRLKWYRYDENRKEMKIPIDQLWECGEEQEDK